MGKAAENTNSTTRNVCAGGRINRITQMEQVISTHRMSLEVQRVPSSVRQGYRIKDHWEEALIKEGASQSYIFTKICVPQFASGHKKGQSRPL